MKKLAVAATLGACAFGAVSVSALAQSMDPQAGDRLQAAQKAAVKLLLPLACFLFPTLFIAILGPAALNLIDTFGKM